MIGQLLFKAAFDTIFNVIKTGYENSQIKNKEAMLQACDKTQKKYAAMSEEELKTIAGNADLNSLAAKTKAEIENEAENI